MQIRNRGYNFREIVKEKCGCKCANCGSDEGIEYHHIVPLFLGGTDRLSNIVALCNKCHKAAHNGRHMNEYRASKIKGGRKPKKDDGEAFAIFDMFVNGEIGKRKAQQLLGYSKGTSIVDRQQFKKYMEANGIKRVHNIIDILAVNSPETLNTGCEVGEIIYNDGNTKKITYKDTGLNDIEYVIRKTQGK